MPGGKPACNSDQYVKKNTRSGECQRDLPVRVLGVKTKYRPELTRERPTPQPGQFEGRESSAYGGKEE